MTDQPTNQPTDEPEEPGNVQPAGAGQSDADMVDTVAEQTASASPRAHDAGKDWNGQSAAPDPEAS